MKPKKNNRRPKKHKPNLKGPYSVEPAKKSDDSFPEDETPEKPNKKKPDPAVIDRQE
ncbi:MAG TPA: hypothetical protein VIM65_04605 [Cyclobacteriaceae bacterium]